MTGREATGHGEWHGGPTGFAPKPSWWDEPGRKATAGPWCPVCRQSVPETGMAWTFPPHGDCEGAGRKVRDADHGFVTEDGRTVPEWEYGVTSPAREATGS